MTSPKSPAAEPGFRVGDRVRHKITGNVGTVSHAGNRVEVRYEKGHSGDASSEHAGMYWERLATPAASEETVEYWCEQPRDEELPTELPDGTVWSWGGGYRIFGAKLNATRDSYDFDRSEDMGGKTVLEASPEKRGTWACAVSEIDWTKVPKRPSPQPVPAATLAVGEAVRSKVTGKSIGTILKIDGLVAFTSGGGKAGWHVHNIEREQPPQPGQSHPSVWGIPREVPPLVVRHFGPDPYAEQRDRESRGLPRDYCDAFARDTRFDKLRASGDPLDRLAASRISHSRRERDGAEVGQGWEAWETASWDGVG